MTTLEPVQRPEPPPRGSERELLETFLDFQRATLLMKCHGLTDEQLRTRSVPPSSMSLLGLLRHMTEIERGWFRRVLADQDAGRLYCSDEDPDADFDGVDGSDAAADRARYLEEVETCRRITAGFESVDEPARAAPPRPQVSLRWILIHMIEEYARHNGHADLLRERIDGPPATERPDGAASPERTDESLE